MSYHHEVDRTHKVLLAVFEGAFTNEVIRSYYNSAPAVIASTQTLFYIGDMSAVTSVEITTDVVRELAGRRALFKDPMLRIAVVPKDALYGLVRMFQMSGQDREGLLVVHTMSEARDALRLGELHFAPLLTMPERTA